MASSRRSNPPEETPLLLEPAALLEHYVWLEAGALDRLAQAPRSQEVRWEVSALRRCSAALLWYFGGYSRFFVERGFRDILRRLRPSEAGVAMYSAHLQEQLELWDQPSLGCLGPPEPHFRFPILEAVSERFHTALGLSPEVVARRARRLALDTHPCSGRYLRWRRDGSVEVVDDDGPAPRDDR